LHHLNGGTKDSAAEVGLGLPEAALEAVGPAAEPGGRGDKSTLVLLVGDNLSKLTLDVNRVLRLTTDARERVDSTGNVALLDVVTRRVREEHETASEDQSPGELDSNRDAVGTGVIAALGSVDDARGEEDTNGNAELVTSNESATDLARALKSISLVPSSRVRTPDMIWGTYNLRHVENDDGRLETDTDTSNHATCNNGPKGVLLAGDHLDYDTDHVDKAAEDDSPLTADPVGKITSDDSTEEGAARENGGDERQVALAEFGGVGAFDSLVEDRRAIDTVDVTGVIAEEDTAERGEGAQEVSLPGDGGFDVIDIFSSGQSTGRGSMCLLVGCSRDVVALEIVSHGDGG
jgi:hypothetical protein